jgi:hypothetical protein
MNKEELIQFIEIHKDNYSIQLKRHHPLLYDKINKLYTFPKFGQKLYHYLNGNDIGKCEICGEQCQFDGIHKGYRKRCSYKCMAQSKYVISHELRNCVICNKQFEIYKNREKTTCSNECLLKLNSSPEVNERRMLSLKKSMIIKYGVNHVSKIPGFKNKLKLTKLLNHGDENYNNIEKGKQTKLEKYGDKNYNNPIKNENTCMRRYGVPNVFHLKKNKTNGKQISNFQKREYEKVLLQYPDAEIEKYLPDVRKSVDIYIPSIKKVIECFGDYWHCNPLLYSESYYHKYIHMNANEIWKKDEERIITLKSYGYDVDIIWENS